MNPYVDTCFLMSEAGRRYLLESGMRFSVIHSVKNELEKLAAKDKNVKAAQEALAFMAQHAELFDCCEQLPEERDILVSNRAGQNVLADSVFRRIAIRCADEQLPVHFLTADCSLAEVLGCYAERITYLERLGGLTRDWRAHRAEATRMAAAELASQLSESDVVFSSSGLRSPFLRQFLLNVQHLAANRKQLRPILHELSQGQICAGGHLPLDVLELLESSDVVRHCGCETPYRSETAMLDALYYARSSGRNVTVIVSGWDDVVQRYDARSHAAEPGADAVNFRVISPAGGLVPLLNAWRLRRLRKPENMTFPLAPKPAPAEREAEAHVDAPAPAPLEPYIPEEEVSSIGSLPAALEKDDQNPLQKPAKENGPIDCRKAEAKYNHLLHQQMDKMKMAEFVAELRKTYRPVDLPSIFIVAIKVARRRNKPAMVTALLNQIESPLPAYCFENWFARSKSNAESPRARDLLLRKPFFDITKRIIARSADLSSCRPAMQVLLTLQHDQDETVNTRARQLQELAVAKGAPVVGKTR